MYDLNQEQVDTELFWAPYNAGSVEELRATIPKLSNRISELVLYEGAVPFPTHDGRIVLGGAQGPTTEALTDSLAYAIGLSEYYRAKDWANLSSLRKHTKAHH